jgi:hypothetical protein
MVGTRLYYDRFFGVVQPVIRCASGMNLIRKPLSQTVAGRRSARKLAQFRLMYHARHRSQSPKWWAKWWASPCPKKVPGKFIRIVIYHRLHCASRSREHSHAFAESNMIEF